MSSVTIPRRLVEHLPLVDLMHFAGYAKSKLDDAATNRTAFGDDRDESAKKFLGRITRLEAYFGTFLLERIVYHPLTHTAMAFRPRNPEELEWILSQMPPSKRATKTEVSSELTLDGKIWASFAQSVFALFDLTEQATAKLAVDPNSSPVVAEILENELAARQIDESAPAYSWDENRRGTRRLPWATRKPVQSAQRAPEVAERHIPTRNHPWDREKYLIWLSHQTTEIADAWRDADEISVFDLAFRVPGIVDPETLERPEWANKPPAPDNEPAPRFVKFVNDVAAVLATREQEEPPHSVSEVGDAFDASKMTKGGQVLAAKRKQEAQDKKSRVAPEGAKPNPEVPPSSWSSQNEPT